MIFIDLNNNSLDNNHSLIQQSKSLFKAKIEIQNKTKKVILNYMQNFSSSNKYIDIDSVNSVHTFLEELKKSINLCNENISNLETLVKSIDDITDSSNENRVNLINNYNSNYIKLTDTLYKNTLQIQDCLCSISERSEFKFDTSSNADDKFKNTFFIEPMHPHQIESTAELMQDSKQEEELSKTENSIIQEKKESITMLNSIENETKIESKPQEISLNNGTIPNTNYIENTLIVSEKNNQVILPFDLTEVNELCKHKNSGFSSIDDVIQKKYTLPLAMYKNTFIARFKEAFKLMRNKEKSSIMEAFDLGFEVMFNYNLHPAIISACKSLDELDIYLDCLDAGEPQKFKCFKIIFDLPPALVKQ